jgi:hypothetical protein
MEGWKDGRMTGMQEVRLAELYIHHDFAFSKI